MQKTLSQQIDYHIAWRLTHLREAREISREQLAALINIPVHDIYRFETAHTAMNARELAIFAKGLEVTPNEFYAQFPENFLCKIPPILWLSCTTGWAALLGFVDLTRGTKHFCA